MKMEKVAQNQSVNIVDSISILSRELIKSYASLNSRIMITREILENSLKLIRAFFKNKEAWMGNIVMGGSGLPIDSYLSVNQIGLQMMKSAVMRV